MEKCKKIKIIGGGPAGCVLGCSLAKAGFDVTIYDTGERPELIVGESLIPALMPYVEKLGLSEEVKKIGRPKPGATIYLEGTEPWSVKFSDAMTLDARYAFNVPRKEFDRIFLDSAIASGCKFEKVKVSLMADRDNDIVWIDQYDEGDLYVDASGRNRIIPQALKVQAERGKRNDVALFSHLDKVEIPDGGNIHMNVFSQGWSWRIPLKDRVSVGFVAPQSYFSNFGEDRETQYERAIAEPFFSHLVQGAVRVAPIMKYSNYQLISSRFYGKNWVLVGDAGGFLDPVFSTGLFLALQGASALADKLISDDLEFRDYEDGRRKALETWSALIDSFYNGRFFSMIKVGNQFRQNTPELFEKYEISKVFATVMAGYGMEMPEIKSQFDFLISFCADKDKSSVEGLKSDLSNEFVQA